MAAPTVVSVHPVSAATGVVLSDTITVLFDQEVDQTTVSLFIEGPDTDRWSGPDLAYWDDPKTTSDDEVLQSPAYKGIVPGTLSFVQINAQGEDVSGSHDYSGTGTIWRSKAVFTPTLPLAPGVAYRVYIVGDEESNDDIVSGVSSRTVFDTVKGSNLGNGEVDFSGGYEGSISDTIHVEMLGTGVAGAINFKWWRESAPAIIRELTTKQTSQLLESEIYVRFVSGTYQVGDAFEAVVKPASRMASTYTWTFTTGSGSITTVSATTPSTCAAIVGGGGSVLGSLTILSIVPVETATHLDPDSVTEVVVTFSEALDEDTIDDDSVLIWTEPVNGDFDDQTITYAGTIAKILSVSGSTLTIRIS
jgi:hypothetical protein